MTGDNHQSDEMAQPKQQPGASYVHGLPWPTIMAYWEDKWPARTSQFFPALLYVNNFPVMVQLDLPGPATAAAVESAAKKQYERLVGAARLWCITANGGICQPTQLVEGSRVLLLPNAPCGASDEVTVLVKRVFPLVKHRLRLNQVRLLLRGENNILSRIKKSQMDENKIKQILMESASKFHMQFKNSKEPPQPKQSLQSQAVSKPGGLIQEQGKQTSQQWQTVTRKVRGGVKGVESSAPSAVPKMTLVDTEWTQAPLEHFRLGVPGVFLEEDLQTAEDHARQLMGSKYSVALVTVKALKFQKHLERVTFTVRQTGADQQQRTRVLSGLINSYGAEPVRYQGNIATVQRRVQTAPTQVITAVAHKQYMADGQWQQVQALTSAAQLTKLIRAEYPDLVIEDCFRMKREDSHAQAMIRIRSSQLTKWLEARKLPMVCMPIGDNAAGYRVMWDRTLCKVEEVYQRYSHIEGFAGVVCSQKGLGFRISASSYQSARTAMGLPGGEVFLLHGVPLDMAEDEIAAIMKDSGWAAEAIPGTKRVRGRVATVKLRAMTVPQKRVLKVVSGREVITLQISDPEVKQRKPEQQLPTPQTWAQALKQGLGKTIVDSEPALASSGRKHPRDEVYQPGPGDLGEGSVRESSAMPMPDSQPSNPTLPSTEMAAQGWPDQPWEEEDDEDMHDEDLWEQPLVTPPAPYPQQSASVRWKKTKASRLGALEQNMSLLQDQMAQILQLMSKGPTQVQHEPAMKASIPWPAQLVIDSAHRRAVPGDGSCLWHSCLACSQSPQALPSTPEEGINFKSDMLARISNNLQRHAAAWTCEVSGVQDAVRSWESEWADGRSLLSVSIEHQVTLIVFNVKEGVIEATASHNAPWTQRIWTLYYTGDHYEPLPVLSAEHLQQIQACMQFQPWRASGESHRGGSLSHHLGSPSNDHVPTRSIKMLTRHRRWSYKGPGQTGKRCHVKRAFLQGRMRRQERSIEGGITSWNIAGWQTHEPDILHFLQSQRPSVLMLQEAKIPASQQRRIQRVLMGEGYNIVFGHPTPRCRNRKGSVETKLRASARSSGCLQDE